MKNKRYAGWVSFLLVCLTAGSLFAVTAEDILGGTENRKGVCILMDCDRALVEDFYANSDYEIYAGFSSRTEYDALMGSTTPDIQAAIGSDLFPEYLPVVDGTIPFPNHYANVIVVNGTTVPDAECERVISPNYEYTRVASGSIVAGYPKTKGIPSGMDNWDGIYKGPGRNVFSQDDIQYPFLSKWATERLGDACTRKKSVFDGMFYAQSDYGSGLTARSAFNGQTLWEYETFPNENWRLLFPITEGYLLRDSVTHELILLDHKTGDILQTNSIPTHDKVITYYDDKLFLRNGDHELIAYDVPTQTVVWSKTNIINFATGYARAEFFIISSGRAYFIDLNDEITGKLYCLDADTGAQLGSALDINVEDQVWPPSDFLSEGDTVLWVYGGTEETCYKYTFSDGQLHFDWKNADPYPGDNLAWDNTTIILPNGGLMKKRKIYNPNGTLLRNFYTGFGCGRVLGSKNGYVFAQMGPVYNYDTDTELAHFANKAECMKISGDNMATFSANNNLFQSTYGCGCVSQWTLYGELSIGGADDGFDYDTVPAESNRLFRETNYDVISDTLEIDGLDWPDFRKNHERSAFSPISTKHTLDGQWSYTPPNAAKATPAVCAETYAFMGFHDGTVRCLETTDGTLVWDFDTGSEIRVSPTLWNSRLYVGCEDGMLYCFEAKTGRLLWRFLTGPKNRKTLMFGKLKSTWPVNSTVIVNDGIAYFAAGRQACDGTYVYAMNATNGAVVWEKNIGAQNTPVSSDDQGNATFLTIGKGYLWVGAFRVAHFTGLKLDTGEVVKHAYENQIGTQGNAQRGVYTGFFRDYLLSGGQYLHDLPDNGEKGFESLSFFKIKDSGGLMQEMFNGDRRILKPGGSIGQTLAWDDDLLFAGKNLHDADLFEAKLNDTFNEGFISDYPGETIISWSGSSSTHKYSSKDYDVESPVILENALIGFDSSSGSEKLKVYHKDASETQTLSVFATGDATANSLIINRSGIAILSMTSGTIHFLDIGDNPVQHTLSVTDGTGDGSYFYTAEAAITADPPPGGLLFNQWDGAAEDIARIDDLYQSNTVLTMPDHDTTIAPLYSELRTLTVANGSGDGSYLPFRDVSITADPPPEGKDFLTWTGNSNVVAALANRFSASTTLYMPDEDTTLTATYHANHDLPWSETFEPLPLEMANVPGALDEQHGWIADAGAIVQAGTVFSGTQALSLENATASHTFLGTPTNIWVTYRAKPVPSDVVPTNIPAGASTAFYINANRQIVAYNAAVSTVIPSPVVSEGWNKFAVSCDYVSKVWNLYLNNVQVVSNFAFYASPPAFSAIGFIEGPLYPVGVDEIQVQSNGMQSVQIDTIALDVPEGSTGSFNVRLRLQPAATVTVAVSRISGDTDISVQSGDSLTFTPADWDIWQPVTLAAADDADWTEGEALFRCSSPGLDNADVTAREEEDDTSPVNVLPWRETFENEAHYAGTLGPLDGQNGWAGGGTVQTGSVHTGTQALSLQFETASHPFIGDAVNVGGTFWMNPVSSSIPPDGFDPDSAVIFYVNTNRQLVAYNSTNAMTLTGTTVSNGWNKFEVSCNYSSKVWNLRLNDEAVVVNFGFYGAPSAFTLLEFSENSILSNSVIDDIEIAEKNWPLLSTNAISVPENGTQTFGLRLIWQPENTATVTVLRVGGDTDITVQSGTTLTFTTNNWNIEQTVTLAAAADIDSFNGSATIRCRNTGQGDVYLTATESDDDRIQVLFSTSALSVLEGSNATFNVRLNSSPSGDITVNTARVSGDTDITVQSGAALLFTPGDWNIEQTVTLAAAEDVDTAGTPATIRSGGPGLLNEELTATETDNDTMAILLSTNTVSVPEDSTADVYLQLSHQPSGILTVHTAYVSGDTDISVQSGETLLFSSTTWSNEQTVTLAAAEDADYINHSATLHCSSPGLMDVALTATEVDNDQVPVEVSSQTVGVPEGATATFDVRLPGSPFGGIITVQVAHVAGDTDLSVQSGASLVFNSTTWSNWQTVTLAAAEDMDETSDPATVRCSAPNMLNRDVTLMEIDNDGPVTFFSEPMDTDPGWTTTALWAFGVPTGQGGNSGEPDPTSGYTGTNVYGYNLDGDYENNIAVTNWLTTSAIDCSNHTNVTLAFQRWLGVEDADFDHVHIEISTNATHWVSLWTNPSLVSDTSWLKVEYDISAIADGQRTVYLRWGMGTTDGSVRYCAWNIDDVELAGDVLATDPDGDSDGLPDWWEEQYFGDTSCNPGDLCSNGVDTVYSAYIAGLDPTNPTNRFLLSVLRSPSSVLRWNSASGRVYSVWWSSNLLGGFQTLETNLPWTSTPYTDTNHPDGEQGFYKIDVELE